MKKQLLGASALVLAFTFTSCGGSEAKPEKTTQEQAEDDIDAKFEESMKELDEDVEQIEDNANAKMEEVQKKTDAEIDQITKDAKKKIDAAGNDVKTIDEKLKSEQSR